MLKFDIDIEDVATPSDLSKLTNVVRKMLLKRLYIMIAYHFQVVNNSNLVWKSQCDVKIKYIFDRIPYYSVSFTPNDFNEILGTIFDQRLKWPNFATNKDLGTFEQRAIKNKIKIKKLQTFDPSQKFQTFDPTHFLNKSFFGNCSFQHTFVFQHLWRRI